MPKMGESIVESTLLKWRKAVGEPIAREEPLCDIATDKVDTDVPSPIDGVLKAILVEEGATVDVGTVIAIVGASMDETPAAAPQAAAPDGEKPHAAAETGSAPAEAAPAAQPAGPEEAPEGKGDLFLSPLVRSIAEKENLSRRELERIAGAGHGGRITKADVLAYLEQRRAAPPEPPQPPAAPQPVAAPRPAPAPPPARPPQAAAPEAPSAAGPEGRVEIIEMSRMRQIIAEHMVRSKATSAHVTSFTEADVTHLVRLRERNKAAFEAREGAPLSFMPFFVRAAVEALHEYPLLNASVEGKNIIVRKDIHIGIAVALGKAGLMAPVLRDAGDKSLAGLARATHDLAARARNKQLQPDELQGGTFTLTNIGSLGSLMGTPIINQPQVAIMATGAIKKRPVVMEDPRLGDVIVVRHMMYLSLSYDHRIIDGAMGAAFLQRFVQELEQYDPEGSV